MPSATAAARSLTPFASGVLLDVAFGLRRVQHAHAIAIGCGLIVAADRLVQAPGGPVDWTEVDDDVFSDDTVAASADAFKLLVIWRPGEERERARVVRAFVDACRRHRRAAIVEGIVRDADNASPRPSRHAVAVIEAAAELTAFGPDLYKAEVPTLGAGTDGEIRAASTRLSAAIAGPWVVLSNGTAAERFPEAMRAAVRGGASGFLAGRAIWSNSTSAPDVVAHLQTVAVPRLRSMAEAVDRDLAARQPR